MGNLWASELGGCSNNDNNKNRDRLYIYRERLLSVNFQHDTSKGKENTEAGDGQLLGF